MRIEKAKRELESKYDLDVYITHARQWAVKITDDERRQETFVSDDLLEAMNDAINYRFIPRYPQRPKPISASQIVPFKSSYGWGAKIGDVDCNVILKTKKATVEWAANAEKRIRDKIEEWDKEVAPKIDGLIAGVDYEWKS